MPLADGTRLEHYEILGPLGAGGMGEVYRAVDTKLRREVALKILPPKFAADPSRLARFEREAHLLASLNHPNIAAIYGLEHCDGIRFLVLELVEGPTLSERLKSGPLEITEALRMGAGIAEALEAAHEKGVVHRDLKPANVKITPAGKVKVLDFGLGKALGDAEAPASGDPEALPTATMGETRAGVVMGTAAYMSPEQAEGKTTDRRSDVWSFGVVLYEMLSGKRCFDGKSTSHIMLKLLEQEPDYTKLPENVPAGVRLLLERCLQKDPGLRLRDVGDLRLLLEAVVKEPALPGLKSRTQRVPEAEDRSTSTGLWVGVVGATAAVGFAALYFWPKAPAPAEVTRFEIAQPAGIAFSNTLALSPDGRKLAFIGAASRAPQIWIRSLDAVEARPLTGTEGAVGAPIWSPDSRSVAFWAQGKVQKIDASGGPAQILFNSFNNLLGGFWTRDNKIVLGVNRQSGLLQVSAAGGEPSPVTTLGSGEGRHASPSLLPDGRHFVYTAAVSLTSGGIYLASFDAKPSQAAKKLLPDVSPVQFAAAGDGGYLLFARNGTLMAQPLDTKRLELTGEAVPVAEQVAPTFAAGFSGFSASPNGTLVYRTGGVGGQQQLTWFDKQGKSLGAVGDPFVYSGTSAPALSPDGKRVAFTRTDSQSGNTDIWLYEFARGVTTRFTFDPGVDQNPVWSPDGSRIVFLGMRANEWGIYQKSSSLVGGEELLYKAGNVQAMPTNWSRDGKYVLYQTTGAGVMALPMEGSEHKPIPLLPPEFNNRGARFSPDGRYFSYLSTESGRDETYVRTFEPSPGAAASAGGKWMVSKDGGGGAHWRADGKELLYFAPDFTLTSVDVTTAPVFQAGVPKAVFKSNAASVYWDSTADGQRFLLPIPVGSNTAAPYSVILNWTSLLRK